MLPCHLQAIFPIQGQKLGFLHGRKILNHLSRHGSFFFVSVFYICVPQDTKLKVKREREYFSTYFHSDLQISHYQLALICRNMELVSFFSSKHACSRSATQSCIILFCPLDYSRPVPPVHGIFQVRILEWVFPSPGDLPTQGSNLVLLHWERQILYHCATWEAPFLQSTLKWIIFFPISKAISSLYLYLYE